MNHRELSQNLCRSVDASEVPLRVFHPGRPGPTAGEAIARVRRAIQRTLRLVPRALDWR